MRGIVIAAALLLASCSTSPIKRIVCKDSQGKTVVAATYDLEAKEIYEYDEFTETLKPAQKQGWMEEFNVAFPESGTIKIQTSVGNLEPSQVNELYVIDPRNKKAKLEVTTRRSKLPDLEGLDGKEFDDALVEFDKIIKSGESTIESKTEKTTATCEFVEPKTTTVFGESAK